MAARSRPTSAPLTFDIPVSLIGKIEKHRRRLGLRTASEVVRLAIDRCDFEGFQPDRDPHRQVSVRLSTTQKAMLKRFARRKNASVGELLRLAIEALAPGRSR